MLELKAKVGPKGQFVLPKPIRDQLGIKPGDEVACSLHEGHAHIAKAAPRDARRAWKDFFDSIPDSERRSITLADLKRLREEQYGAGRKGWR